MNIASLGEFGLIGRIAERVSTKDGVRCGIGDDAAALEPAAGSVQLVTSDMLLEGVHFDLAYTPPELLGRKSLAVNLSDMAAMGGKARWFLLSLGLPAATDVTFLDRFVSGMLEMAGLYGVALVGGDTCASKSGLVISITLIGEQLPNRVVYRSGAKPGDLICVTGTLGDSALGLAELRQGKRDGVAVARHLDPVPRCSEGLMLAEAGIPSAMIDLSDGLLADLGHILEGSGAGARFEISKIPCSPHFSEHAAKLGADPLPLALSGGEDYELLFTAAPECWPDIEKLFAGAPSQVTVIGEITAAGGIQAVLPSGERYLPDSEGFRHF
ncbi:thiamine-phosphate kinase [Geobacter pelophilus]|uniref:Thiamine-monophosphate kinase n=1 Tax=Geoanaerobacter pelophilus TaxID=60036 RepID=A0AAW4L032_9BACT|nr:thiamine-phosphate kinase [Geoanaerobacter pelophilus]MBT0664019.1 thiamine-phosphate kinase [Geoanaerobacter pelophilus]